ncbi:sulfotransferase family 2 domain-containing protein [Sedimentitalea sp. XS_ASV28]|uniref:sulfotransferase family 2 domain-containing protein n=1 Tax=Sedimentitalea sp. XS_ASV28 TaxID=3241296 RepID=UPI00351251C5
MVVHIDAYKIAYMPLPKAACTSVKAGLALVDPAIDTSLETIAQNPDIVHGYYRTRRFRPHRWQAYEGWWRFAVVRDPLKRLLSAYTDRVVKRRDLYKSPKLRRQDATLPRDPDPDFFFRHLPEYRQAASVIKHHVLPAHLFIGLKPHRYDRVYKIEEMGELARDLAERIGQDVNLPRFNESSDKLDYADLQPDTQSCIREFLNEDYEQLDAYYPRPW